MQTTFRLFFILLLFCILESCSKNKDSREDEHLTTNQKLNLFIESQMKDIYLWADDVKDRTVNTDLSPQQFLEKLMISDDEWSLLVHNGIVVVRSSISGGTKTTIGYSLSFYQYNNNQIFGMIDFIYPGSPAAAAGLKRGDMIVTNHGKTLNENNFWTLELDPQVEIQLGQLNKGEIITFDKRYTLTARNMTIDPILTDTVLQVGNKKAGYLLYTEFIDNESTSLDDLNQAIGKFKQASVDEIILDLRYNTGGAITAAQRLSSLLAPVTNVSQQDMLYTEKWNNKYQEIRGDANKLIIGRLESEALPYNPDLDRIFILTGDKTASGSELVISGLSPYTNVITIGEKTTGKYVGSMERTSTDPALEGWELYPIVFEYRNARSESVKGGIAPAFEESEYINYRYPLCDPEDPLLKVAFSLITGDPVITSLATRTAASKAKVLKSPFQQSREMLIQK